MKKHLRTFLAPMVALTLVLGAGTGRAAVIPINDAGFESPIQSPGGAAGFSASTWVGVPGHSGVFYPGAGQYSQNFPIGPGSGYVPEGNQVGWVDSSGNIDQILTGYTLQANTLYTLSGYIGNRLDATFTTATVRLYAAESVSVLASETITAPTAGTFMSWSLNFWSDTSVHVGETLQVELGGPNGGTQVNYDNISLTAVPEPVNMALALFGIIAVSGSVGRFYLARRRLATAG